MTTRPDRGPGRRRATRVLVPVLALVLGAAVGIGGWIALAPSGFRGTPVGQSTDHDASLSVTINDRPGGAEVRAVVAGLGPGAAYNLVAVADDGRNYVVAAGRQPADRRPSWARCRSPRLTSRS